jgi:hypothetical protein
MATLRVTGIIVLTGLLGLAALLAACTSGATQPTPDVQAAVSTALAQTRTFEDAVATSIAATMTASAPSATVAATPTDTPAPSPSAAPPALTSTPPPPADTPVPTSTSTPPPPPTSTPAPTVEKLAIAESDVDGNDGNDFLRGSSNSNQGRVVLLPGFKQADVSRPMVFRDRIVFRVEVFDTRVGLYDGDGIDHVTFHIVDNGGSGEEVYSRKEQNAGYCVFGGGEPDCNVLVFAQSGNRWPNGRKIDNGPYQAQIDIVPKHGDGTQWRWNFNIDMSGQAGNPPQPQPNTARIDDIRVEGDHYAVDFETFGFEPTLPGQHVHFFFNNVPPEQAGVPGSGPWQLYPTAPGQPNTSPFTLFSVSQRPPDATQICILVANNDHSVNLGTGNCVDLP